MNLCIVSSSYQKFIHKVHIHELHLKVHKKKIGGLNFIDFSWWSQLYTF